MAMKFTCDRCGRSIPKPIERLKLIVDEMGLRCDLCAACSDSLRAWVRNEPTDAMRSLTT
jgi:DNA-directed RNA polymerase subunit RPC12/RpoP